MIGKIIEAIRPGFEAKPYVERFGGLATPVRQIVETELGPLVESYPISQNVTDPDCWSSGEYLDLVPDSDKKSIFYFEDLTGLQFTEDKVYRQSLVFTAHVRLVGWLNIQKLGYLNNNITDDIILNAVAHFKKLEGSFTGIRYILKAAGQPVKSVDIFGRYHYADRSDLFIYPFDFFAIDMELKIIVGADCIPEFTLNDPGCVTLSNVVIPTTDFSGNDAIYHTLPTTITFDLAHTGDIPIVQVALRVVMTIQEIPKAVDGEGNLLNPPYEVPLVPSFTYTGDDGDDILESGETWNISFDLEAPPIPEDSTYYELGLLIEIDTCDQVGNTCMETIEQDIVVIDPPQAEATIPTFAIVPVISNDVTPIFIPSWNLQSTGTTRITEIVSTLLEYKTSGYQLTYTEYPGVTVTHGTVPADFNNGALLPFAVPGNAVAQLNPEFGITIPQVGETIQFRITITVRDEVGNEFEVSKESNLANKIGSG